MCENAKYYLATAQAYQAVTLDLRADLARVTAERDANFRTAKAAGDRADNEWSRARAHESELEHLTNRLNETKADLARARAALLSLPERDATEKLARARVALEDVANSAGDGMRPEETAAFCISRARAFLASGDVEKSRGIETAPPAHPDNCRSPDCYDAPPAPRLCFVCGGRGGHQLTRDHEGDEYMCPRYYTADSEGFDGGKHARPAPAPVDPEWEKTPLTGQPLPVPIVYARPAPACTCHRPEWKPYYDHAPDCPARQR